MTPLKWPIFSLCFFLLVSSVSAYAAEPTDSPPTSDVQATQPDEKDIFVSVGLGTNWSFAGTANALSRGNVLFSWGGRIGFHLSKLGDFSTVSLAASFDRATHSELDGTAAVSASYTELMAHILFEKLCGTGFYAGPELGLGIRSSSVNVANVASVDLGTATTFDVGIEAGYDYYFNDAFSLGPNVQFTELMSGNYSSNSVYAVANPAGYEPLLKVLLVGTLHF